MKYLFVHDFPPLTLMLDLQISNVNIDLHNDFECIAFRSENNAIEFLFKKVQHKTSYNESNAVVVFSNLVETNFHSILDEGKLGDIKTITNFGKGDLTSDSKYYLDNTIKYFFIDFVDGKLIHLFCKEAIIILW